MKNNLIKFFICAVIFGVAAIANAKKPKNIQPKEEVIPTYEIIDNDTVYIFVEKMPQFPGGNTELFKFINDNLRWPAAFGGACIQGKVACRFIVEKDGSITNIEIIRSLHPACDKESIRVIESMPKWEAGEQDGNKVRVFYTLPITYRLINN